MIRPFRRRFRGFSESHEFARHVDIATSLPEVSAIYDTDNMTRLFLEHPHNEPGGLALYSGLMAPFI